MRWWCSIYRLSEDMKWNMSLSMTKQPHKVKTLIKGRVRASRSKVKACYHSEVSYLETLFCCKRDVAKPRVVLTFEWF